MKAICWYIFKHLTLVACLFTSLYWGKDVLNLTSKLSIFLLLLNAFCVLCKKLASPKLHSVLWAPCPCPRGHIRMAFTFRSVIYLKLVFMNGEICFLPLSYTPVTQPQYIYKAFHHHLLSPSFSIELIWHLS